ncbi:nucleotidyltransferase family protein [Longimicrobium sp.]|uniref:nucleotidyltransferase domain-containing protein n=1 Tax=Longimicrobium sp. TaxID=2029185 RepID=UPI002F95A5D9
MTAIEASSGVDAAPEAALVLLAARAAVDASTADGVADVVGRGVDWDAALALAEKNRLTPLLHRLLAGQAEVPQPVRATLRSAYAANAGEALRLSGELRRLVSALEQAGVAALAYKGPALAVRAYGQVALRTYSDLDLLVAPEDVPRAARALAERGYAAAYSFSPAQERLFLSVDGDVPFHHPHTGTLVELHSRVSSARFCIRLPTAELMARARPVSIGGGTVPTLADDDLFLALCAHGAKHRWARLEWLASTGALAARAELDLRALGDRAGEAGARRTVLLALHLAGTTLGLPLPPSLAQAAAVDPEIPSLAKEARGLWFAPATDEDSTAANLRFNYRLCDGRADRARYAARWLFTPTPEDWSWLRLPAPLAPAYRALRPLRLALRYAPGRGW